MTNKTFKHIIFSACVIILCIVTSCNSNKQTEALLREMESKPIELCFDSLSCYLNGVDTTGYVPKNYDYLLIVNIDSSECSSCLLNNLDRWDEWIDFANKKNSAFGIIFVVQPKEGNSYFIQRKIKILSQRYYKQTPFYLDNDGIFMRTNFRKKIPTYMQTMLLDKFNMVIYVGNPTINVFVKAELNKIINI